MQYQKSYRPSFTLAGIARRTSNAHPEQIGAFWGRFRAEKIAQQLPQRTSDAIYALYSEYDSDHTGEYTMLLGYEVPTDAEVPEGMHKVPIPAAAYAVVDARGPQPETLTTAWQQVWSSSLPRSYGCDFDIYWGPETVEIYVSID